MPSIPNKPLFGNLFTNESQSNFMNTSKGL